MMNSILPALFAFSSGGLLGMVFYGGLWWTVRRGLASTLPALWFSASGLIRTAIAVGGFYFVSHGAWHPLLACLLGFFLMRLAVMRVSRASAARPGPSMIEASP